MTWRVELPSDRMPPGNIRKSLDPWFLPFLSLGAEEVSSRLAREWKGLKNPLAKLRDHLLPARNAALTGRKGEAFLEICRGIPFSANGDVPENERWMSMYLRPPQPREKVLQRIKELNLPRTKSFIDFHRVFSGLRDSEPGSAGGFERVEDWRTFRDDLGKYAKDREPEDLRKWGDAVVLFHARDGSHVLMSSDGRLAWDVMQENRVDEKWRTFDEFIEHFADYLGYNWPFDSYGPSHEAVEQRRRREKQ